MTTDEIKARLAVLDVEMAAPDLDDDRWDEKWGEYFDLFTALPFADRVAWYYSLRDRSLAIEERLTETWRDRGVPQEKIDAFFNGVKALQDAEDSGDR